MKFYKVKNDSDGKKVYGDTIRTLIADELLTPDEVKNLNINIEDIELVDVMPENIFEFLGAFFEY